MSQHVSQLEPHTTVEPSETARPSPGVPLLAVAVLALGFGLLSQVSQSEGFFAGLEQKLWFACAAFAAVGLLHARIGPMGVIRRSGLPFALLVGWTLALASSSLEPMTTVIELMGLVGTVVIGVYLGSQLTGLELVQAGRAAALLVGAASWLALAVNATWARGADGLPVGLLTHRNSLGALAGFGLVLTVVGGYQRRSMLVLGWVLFGSLLVVSQSRTAQVGTFVAVAVLVCARLIGRDQRLGMAAAVFAVAAMLVGLGTVGGLGGVSAGLGKSETLTGRTELWSVVVERGSVPTLTGQGFGTAWIDNSPVRVAVDARFPGIVSAHNIFLEWFIAVGVVGAVLVLLVVLDALRIAARSRVRQRFSSEALIAVATFVLVRGLAEAGFPNKNSSATILAFALMSTLRSAPRRSEAPS